MTKVDGTKSKAVAIFKLRKLWRVGVLSAPVLVALAMLWATNLALDKISGLNDLQSRLNDEAWLQLPRIEADKRIVLVTIDKDSKSKFGRGKSEVGFPRSDYSELIKVLKQSDPACIAIDTDFHNMADVNNDHMLSALQLPNAPVVLAAVPTEDEAVEDPSTSGSYRLKFVTLKPLEVANVYRGSVVNYTPDGPHIGCVPLRTDFSTSKNILHLSIAAAAFGMGSSPHSANFVSGMDRLRIGSSEWELGADQEVLTRWTSVPDAFDRFSIENVTHSDVTTNRKRFEGKIVIVGDIRPGIDSVSTPLFGEVPGVYFVAQMVNTFLMPTSLNCKWAPGWLQSLLAIALSVVSSFCILSARKALMILGPIALVGLAWHTPILTTQMQGIRMEAIILVFPTLATSIVVAMFLAIKAGRFDTRLAGDTKDGSILFVDVRESTVMTREIGGRRYQQCFTDFMRRVSPDIESHGGHVERTMGDGFVAVFPNKGGNNSSLSCLSALKKIIGHAHDTSKKVGHSFEILAGFENGPMTGGYVTENGVRSWSTSGNTVNFAARLLKACEELRVPYVVGPVAAALMQEEVELKVVGKFMPKGFDKDFVVYIHPDDSVP